MKKTTIILLLFVAISLLCDAETIIITPQSTKTAKVDGDLPWGTITEYVQTGAGKTGQVTADNYIEFRLWNMPTIWLKHITLQMHSNTNTGACGLDVVVNDNLLYEKAPNFFDDESWAGTYSVTDVPISIKLNPWIQVDEGQTLHIFIDGYVNSVYITQIEIEYSTHEQTPYIVSFNTHSSNVVPSLTEEFAGSGVILPLPSQVPADWFFLGWLESPEFLTNEKPIYYSPNTIYYPEQNTELYAVYSSQQILIDATKQDTLLESGDYLIADYLYKCLAVGSPHKKHLHAQKTDIIDFDADSLCTIVIDGPIPDSAVYSITFNENKALIKHKLTNTWISYPSSPKTDVGTDSLWWDMAVIRNHQLLFYHDYVGDYHRELRASRGVTANTVDSLWFISDDATSQRVGLLLFRVNNTGSVNYTSFPNGTANPSIYDVDNMIVNGVVQNNNGYIMLFDVAGKLITKTTQNLNINALPSGTYILVSDEKVLKFIKD